MHLGTINRHLVQKVLILLLYFAKMEVSAMKKLSEPAKMISMTILAGIVLCMLMFITHSACAVFFSQPKEPTKLYSCH